MHSSVHHICLFVLVTLAVNLAGPCHGQRAEVDGEGERQGVKYQGPVFDLTFRESGGGIFRFCELDVQGVVFVEIAPVGWGQVPHLDENRFLGTF